MFYSPSLDSNLCFPMTNYLMDKVKQYTKKFINFVFVAGLDDD